MQEKEVGPACVYNADQTGMFYAKLPNSLYVDKNNKNDYKGSKQIKDKLRVMAMISTSADGYRLPVLNNWKTEKAVLVSASWA